MSNGNTPRDEVDLEAFLARKSPLSTAYDAIEPVQPPEVLDAKILAIAKGAANPAKAPAGTENPPVPKPAAASRAVSAAEAPPARPSNRAEDDDDEDEEDDEAPPARRPRWLLPAALAVSLLVAVGVGVTMLGIEPSGPGADPGATNRLGSLFAKRVRERSEADKATAEAAAASQEAEVEFAPLPPPPVFEPEGPQVEDLDAAIALIRKELVLASQLAAIAEDARAGDQPLEINTVIQPRDRRLAKILELHDGGNPDLAAASLEIFLRDFEDDPISQRILDAQPKVTDAAVE